MEETMVDKITFMETLRSVAEITKTSNEPLSREEIQKYFENMDLSEEQQEMVYQYFLTPQPDITENEVESSSEQENTNQELLSEEDLTDEVTSGEDTELKSEELSDSSFFQMYLEDVNVLPEVSKKEEQELYKQLQDGDEYVLTYLSDLWLKRVIELAKVYSSRNVNMEDVIQEGNIGLLLGLKNLIGNKDDIDIEGYLTQSIKESMEQYIDEVVNDDDWESTVLAKATLIHEALKALTEELGRTPSLSELCDYTKISVEEITDILSLSKEESK